MRTADLTIGTHYAYRPPDSIGDMARCVEVVALGKNGVLTVRARSAPEATARGPRAGTTEKVSSRHLISAWEEWAASERIRRAERERSEAAEAKRAADERRIDPNRPMPVHYDGRAPAVGGARPRGRPTLRQEQHDEIVTLAKDEAHAAAIVDRLSLLPPLVARDVLAAGRTYATGTAPEAGSVGAVFATAARLLLADADMAQPGQAWPGAVEWLPTAAHQRFVEACCEATARRGEGLFLPRVPAMGAWAAAWEQQRRRWEDLNLTAQHAAGKFAFREPEPPPRSLGWLLVQSCDVGSGVLHRQSCYLVQYWGSDVPLWLAFSRANAFCSRCGGPVVARSSAELVAFEAASASHAAADGEIAPWQITALRALVAATMMRLAHLGKSEEPFALRAVDALARTPCSDAAAVALWGARTGDPAGLYGVDPGAPDAIAAGLARLEVVASVLPPQHRPALPSELSHRALLDFYAELCAVIDEPYFGLEMVTARWEEEDRSGGEDGGGPGT